MTESPGWINSTPLIEEMATKIGNYIYGYVDSEETPNTWETSMSLAKQAIGVLRYRGLINQQGLELIQREMGE